MGKRTSPGLYYGSAFAFSGTLGMLVLTYVAIKYIGRRPDQVVLSLDNETLNAQSGEVAERLNRDMINVPFFMNSKYLDEFHQCVLVAILVYLVAIVFSLMIGATLSLRRSMYDTNSSGWFGQSHEYYLKSTSKLNNGGAAFKDFAEPSSRPNGDVDPAVSPTSVAPAGSAGPSRQTTLNGQTPRVSHDQTTSAKPSRFDENVLPIDTSPSTLPAMLFSEKLPNTEAVDELDSVENEALEARYQMYDNVSRDKDQKTSSLASIKVEQKVNGNPQPVMSPTHVENSESDDKVKPDWPNAIRCVAPQAHFPNEAPIPATKVAGKRRASYSSHKKRQLR